MFKTTKSLWTKNTIPAESFLAYESDRSTEYYCDNPQCLRHAASENKLKRLLEWDFVYDVLHIVDKYEKEPNVVLASKADADFFFDPQLQNPMYICACCHQNIFKNSSTCVYTLLNNNSSSCSASHAQLVDAQPQSNAVVCMTGCLDIVTGSMMLTPAIYFPNEIQSGTEVLVFREFTLPGRSKPLEVKPVPSQSQRSKNNETLEYSEESHDLHDALLKSTALFKSQHKQYDASVAQSLARSIDESRMIHNINTTRAEMKISPLYLA
jgi:hypothetical protein